MRRLAAHSLQACPEEARAPSWGTAIESPLTMLLCPLHCAHAEQAPAVELARPVAAHDEEERDGVGEDGGADRYLERPAHRRVGEWSSHTAGALGEPDSARTRHRHETCAVTVFWRRALWDGN